MRPLRTHAEPSDVALARESIKHESAKDGAQLWGERHCPFVGALMHKIQDQPSGYRHRRYQEVA